MSTQAQETIQRLCDLRRRLDEMAGLNADQQYVEAKIRKVQTVNADQVKPVSKLRWLLLTAAVAGIYILIAWFFVKTSADYIYDTWDEQYDAAVYFDEAMWEDENSGAENPPPYPGYRGPLKEQITYGDAVLKAMNDMAFWLLCPMYVIGIIIYGCYRAKITEIKGRHRMLQRIMERNRHVVAGNDIVKREVQEILKKKEAVSRAFLREAGNWFPLEYSYDSAVDFFIHELQYGMAATLGEAVNNYRAEQHRKIVERKLDQLDDKMSIVIQNQNVIVSSQEALLRQQIVGNAIAFATWAEAERLNTNWEFTMYGAHDTNWHL